MSAGAALRALIADGGMVVAPGVYDGVSAHAVQSAGFDAAYMSGGSLAVSLTGFPDLGFTTLTEVAGQLDRITNVLSVPLIADGDTGYGGPLQVQRTMRAYERAGAAAIQLEDQEFPKRCGHLRGKSLIPAEEFAMKIRAAVDARTDPNFMIIARTDAIATHGFDEAVRRVEMYVEAGADIIFVEAQETLDQVKQVPKIVDVPTLFNYLPASSVSPDVSLDDLEEWGYSVVIASGACLWPHVAAVRDAMAALKKNRAELTPTISLVDIFESAGLSDWLAVSERYATPVDGDR